MKCSFMDMLAPQIIFSYPVVHVAVGEHGVEVLYAVECLPVIFVLKTLLNGAQIHRLGNNCIIILKDNNHSLTELIPDKTLFDAPNLRV